MRCRQSASAAGKAFGCDNMPRNFSAVAAFLRVFKRFTDRRVPMKMIFAPLVLLASVAFAGTVSAHHAAEGIISDDIWEMIDDLLEAADSPHLDLDFTMMGSAVMTTIEVDTAMVTDILAAVASVNNGRLLVATQESGDGLTSIIIVEPVGSGQSQIIYQ